MRRAVVLIGLVGLVGCGGNSQGNSGREQVAAEIESAIQSAETAGPTLDSYKQASNELLAAKRLLDDSPAVDVSTFDEFNPKIEAAIKAVAKRANERRAKEAAGWADFEGQFMPPEEREQILAERRAEQRAERRRQAERERAQKRAEAEREAAEQEAELAKAGRERRERLRREAAVASLEIEYDEFKDSTTVSAPATSLEFTDGMRGGQHGFIPALGHDGKGPPQLAQIVVLINHTGEDWLYLQHQRSLELIFLVDGDRIRKPCAEMSSDVFSGGRCYESLMFLLTLEEATHIASARSVKVSLFVNEFKLSAEQQAFLGALCAYMD